MCYLLYILLLFTIFWTSLGNESPNSTVIENHEPENHVAVRECGRTSLRSRQERVIGGKRVEDRELPFMVFLSLGYKSEDNKDYFLTCGGSIISPHLILTAAHCVVEKLHYNGVEYSLYDWTGVVGLSNLDMEIIETISTVYGGGPEDVIPHPEYNLHSFLENDAALIRVHDRINFTDSIQPICLPLPQDVIGVFNRVEVIVAGWGYTKNPFISDYMHKATVLTMDYKKCQKRFRRMTLKETMFCTKRRKSNACLGDSGGPVILINEQGYAVQIGIISFSVSAKTGGCLSYVPTVHTYLPSVLSWIEQVSQTNSTDQSPSEHPKYI